MSNKKSSTSEQIKSFLSAAIGGAKGTWKRTSKRRYNGDVLREFVSKKSPALKVTVAERGDGLLCAILPDDTIKTARLQLAAAFDKAAKPSAVDLVLNDMLERRPVNPPLLKQALKEGLARHFKFYISHAGDDNDSSLTAYERTYAAIYPAMRDSTFKTNYDYIRPMIKGAVPNDECVETEWRRPAKEKMHAPVDLARYFLQQGLTWDKETQRRSDKNMYKKIKKEFKKKAPKKKNTDKYEGAKLPPGTGIGRSGGCMPGRHTGYKNPESW